MLDAIAEMSLLGSILIDPVFSLPVARGILRVEDIFDSRIRAAYGAACELADAGDVLDPVTIQNKAATKGLAIDGQFLVHCMDQTVTAANISIYAEAVHGEAIRRSIQALGQELAEDALTDPKEMLRSTIARLQALQLGSNAKPDNPADVARSFLSALSEAAEGKLRPFIPTGFQPLDELLGGGLVSSGVITLAARTGIGKTVTGLCIADNIAEFGNPVLYVSLEMDANQLMARRVGRIAGISYNRLQRGDIEKSDAKTWRRVISALSELSKRPLYISDKPASIGDIELKARSISDLSLIVIDHMGLIKSENPHGKLYEQVTAISHSLKLLALSLGVPILSLCQLNRESEARSDHRPGLADLRNSGAVEEDSDAVILLHRPSVYLPDSERPKPWEDQELELIVAKNRHGLTGAVTLGFQGMISSVYDPKQGFWPEVEKTPWDGGTEYGKERDHQAFTGRDYAP